MTRTIIIVLLAALAASSVFAAESLTNDQAEDILYLLEEEKMARDLYTALGEQWNLRVFANISSSEDRHMSRVADLADSYGLEYRILPPGEYVLPEIRDLYASLLDQGMASSRAALEVGRSVEILDIADLDSMIDLDPPGDVAAVLESLRRGSENHLQAFERQLGR